jgi:hypothetical protein
MKSALIGAAVGVALGSLTKTGTFAWMVPTASSQVEAAAYWISYFGGWALLGFVVAGFSSKRLPKIPSRAQRMVTATIGLSLILWITSFFAWTFWVEWIAIWFGIVLLWRVAREGGTMSPPDLP